MDPQKLKQMRDFQTNLMSGGRGRAFLTEQQRKDVDGIVEETIAQDASGKICVVKGDKAQGQTLTNGARHYAQTDGTMGTTETAYPVGDALSTTELLLLI